MVKIVEIEEVSSSSEMNYKKSTSSNSDSSTDKGFSVEEQEFWDDPVAPTRPSSSSRPPSPVMFVRRSKLHSTSRPPKPSSNPRQKEDEFVVVPLPHNWKFVVREEEEEDEEVPPPRSRLSASPPPQVPNPASAVNPEVPQPRRRRVKHAARRTIPSEEERAKAKASRAAAKEKSPSPAPVPIPVDTFVSDPDPTPVPAPVLVSVPNTDPSPVSP